MCLSDGTDCVNARGCRASPFGGVVFFSSSSSPPFSSSSLLLSRCRLGEYSRRRGRVHFPLIWFHLTSFEFSSILGAGLLLPFRASRERNVVARTDGVGDVRHHTHPSHTRGSARRCARQGDRGEHWHRPLVVVARPREHRVARRRARRRRARPRVRGRRERRAAARDDQAGRLLWRGVCARWVARLSRERRGAEGPPRGTTASEGTARAVAMISRVTRRARSA